MNKQLLYLFLGSFIIVHVGNGLFPLLPLYAAQFGATPATIGLYMAITYMAITAGTMLSSRAVEILTPRGTIAGAGTLGIPTLIMLGQATALWHVVVLTAVLWFTGGMALASISVLTGLSADENKRGASFSLLSLAGPLGALIGGITVGKLVAWYGYPTMFTMLGLTWFGLPALGLFAIEDAAGAQPTELSSTQKRTRALPSGWAFYLLLFVSLLAAITINVGRLGTSLSMQELAFSSDAVASTATVSGLITVPVVLFIGTLSDRLGRKRFLMTSVLLAAVGTLTLSMADQLWHFWAAATLLLVGQTVSGAVASAFATDVLPRETLNRGLPWLTTMRWIAGIISFAGSGYAVSSLGPTVLYLAAASIAGGALLVLHWLPQQTEHTKPRPPDTRTHSVLRHLVRPSA